MSRRPTAIQLDHKHRSLKNRHRQLEIKISEEMARPLPDFTVIQSLKRRRLKTKDELELIDGVLQTLARPWPQTVAHP